MENAKCLNCSVLILPDAYFCYKCGSQAKCKECNESLKVGMNFCTRCGSQISNRTSIEHQSINTIKFKETQSERSYEISFTNDVGKEVSQVVAYMLNNKKVNAEGSNILKQSNENNFEIDQEVDNKSIKDLNFPPSNDNDFPHINDVEMKIDASEFEWILIYSFYSSQFAKKTFSRDSVYDLYKAKRGTETRLKNFATHWKNLFKSYIGTVKDNEFKILPDGCKAANSLITGEAKGKNRNRIPKKGNSKNKDIDKEL